MSNWREDCRVTGFLDEGETEHWRVRRFTVSDEHNLLGFGSFFRTGRGRTPPGEYTQLLRKTERGGEVIVMSDTRDEIHDLSSLFWSKPQGRILVNGLGLGCAIKGLLAIPEVERIDVVEISREVIDLVGSQFTDPRLVIHEGDAFTYEWPAGTRWDRAWHDVWEELNEDNLSNEESAHPGTYAKLNRRYGRRSEWQGAWGQAFLKSQRDRYRGVYGW